MSTSIHIAVMPREIIEGVQPRSGGRYIDATLGGATHTEALLKACAPKGKVLSLDLDPKALERAKTKLRPYGKRWTGVEGNFRNIEAIAGEQGMAPCDGIIMDLGLSSDELEDPDKGMSFQINAPLDMRFGPHATENGLTAATIVNQWNARDLERIIRDYGEERYARRIAEAIVTVRKQKRLLMTNELADLIRSAVPGQSRIHPATRTFQALRIAVNDELAALEEAIIGARAILAPGARLAIISFHSLEDRVVKHAFRQAEDLAIITKRPLTPTETEILQNPRSRSAKLRVAQKL